MNFQYLILFKIVLLMKLFFFGPSLLAQEVQKIIIPLSDPNKPGKLIVNQSYGSIDIKAYEGDEIYITATPREDSSGLLQINSSSGQKSFQINYQEYENTVTVAGPTNGLIVDLAFKVPQYFSLELDALNNGDIIVENVIGEIEASNNNGKIEMHNVGGTVIADALNKDISVSFNGPIYNAPMVFTNMNGKIEITYPKDIKAKIKAFSEYGDFYSEFKLLPLDDKDYENSKKEERRQVNWICGLINEGGPEIKLDSFNGDIYLKIKK